MINTKLKNGENDMQITEYMTRLVSSKLQEKRQVLLINTKQKHASTVTQEQIKAYEKACDDLLLAQKTKID